MALSPRLRRPVAWWPSGVFGNVMLSASAKEVCSSHPDAVTDTVGWSSFCLLLADHSLKDRSVWFCFEHIRSLLAAMRLPNRGGSPSISFAG